MELSQKIECLYGKGIKENYRNLLELEKISQEEPALLPYLGQFIDMIGNDKYEVRVRGFRMVCAQAKWDTEGFINENVKTILSIFTDSKPTAIRQALAASREIVKYKPELFSEIMGAADKIDLARQKDSMRPLIEKDIEALRTTGSNLD